MRSAVVQSQVRLAKMHRAEADESALRWGSLYAVLLVAVALCGLGYRVATSFGRPGLVQAAVVLLVLGLLWGWTRLYRSVLMAPSSDVFPPGPSFSVIRIPLTLQRLEGHQPPAEAARPADPDAIVHSAHSALR